MKVGSLYDWTTNYIKKGFQQKLFRIKFPTKNSVDAYVYLPLGVELGGSKDCHFWNIIMYWNLQKVTIVSNNAETKKVHSHNHWASKRIFFGTKDLSSEPCKIYISFMVFEENGCQTTKNVDIRVKRTPHKNLGYVHLQNSQNSKLIF